MTPKEAIQAILEEFKVSTYNSKTKKTDTVIWLNAERYVDGSTDGHPLNYPNTANTFPEDLCEGRTSYERLLDYCSEMGGHLERIGKILSKVDSEELDPEWEDLMDLNVI